NDRTRSESCVSCDELTGQTISESLVRLNLVVVGDPSSQLAHYGFGIWSRTDADIVALDRANEGFSHSVALWTFERPSSSVRTRCRGRSCGCRRRRSSCHYQKATRSVDWS